MGDEYARRVAKPRAVRGKGDEGYQRVFFYISERSRERKALGPKNLGVQRAMLLAKGTSNYWVWQKENSGGAVSIKVSLKIRVAVARPLEMEFTEQLIL